MDLVLASVGGEGLTKKLLIYILIILPCCHNHPMVVSYFATENTVLYVFLAVNVKKTVESSIKQL